MDMPQGFSKRERERSRSRSCASVPPLSKSKSGLSHLSKEQTLSNSRGVPVGKPPKLTRTTAATEDLLLSRHSGGPTGRLSPLKQQHSSPLAPRQERTPSSPIFSFKSGLSDWKEKRKRKKSVLGSNKQSPPESPPRISESNPGLAVPPETSHSPLRNDEPAEEKKKKKATRTPSDPELPRKKSFMSPLARNLTSLSAEICLGPRSAPTFHSSTPYPPSKNKKQPSASIRSISIPPSRFVPLLKEVLNTTEGDQKSLLVSTLAVVHGDPVQLFEDCLRKEAIEEPHIEVLLRHTSPSVSILQSIGKPFMGSISALVSPLIEFCQFLTQSDIDELLPPELLDPCRSPPPHFRESPTSCNSAPVSSPTLCAQSPLFSASSSSSSSSSPCPLSASSSPAYSTSSCNSSCALSSSSSEPSSFLSPTVPNDSSEQPSSFLQTSFHKSVASLLSACSFHPLFHILCYRATQVAKEELGGEEDKIRQWAVTAVLFLRFIVPTLTIQSPRASSVAARFMGKFVMKLCTDSTFTPNSSSPADHLISSLSPLFASFCDEMVDFGEKAWLAQKDNVAEKEPPLAKVICRRLSRCAITLQSFLSKLDDPTIQTVETSEPQK